MPEKTSKEYLNEKRNEIKRCPCCNGNIEDRKISLYKELVNSLYKVYVWLGERRIHEFEMKDIKHLLGKNEYARFGDLVRFGGVVYRPKEDGNSRKAFYGMNMARAKEFFAGTRTIPVQITLNQITNEIVSQVDCYYDEFPSLVDYLKQHGLFDYELRIVTGNLQPSKKPKEKKIRLRPQFNKNGTVTMIKEEYEC